MHGEILWHLRLKAGILAKYSELPKMIACCNFLYWCTILNCILCAIMWQSPFEHYYSYSAIIVHYFWIKSMHEQNTTFLKMAIIITSIKFMPSNSALQVDLSGLWTQTGCTLWFCNVHVHCINHNAGDKPLVVLYITHYFLFCPIALFASLELFYG